MDEIMRDLQSAAEKVATGSLGPLPVWLGVALS